MIEVEKMFFEYLRIAWSNLKERKLRAWLTMLGIIIGILAVVALISLGQGLQKAIEEEFESLGSDKLIVKPGGTSGVPGSDAPAKLTEDDFEVLEQVNGVKLAAKMISRVAKVEVEDQVGYHYVTGVPVDEARKVIESVQNFEVAGGRDLRSGDSKKAVVGYHYVHGDFFKETTEVGDKIFIEDKGFEIVGELDRIGNDYDDSSVIVPFEDLKDILNTGEVLDYIFLQVNKGEDIGKVERDVEKELRNYRDVDEGEEDFVVQTPQSLMESFNNILNAVQAVVVGLALISLIVGSVGIMNTMYTAVVQRTKEIGVMKAVGAKNSDILIIFLIEAGFLGLIGGGIGTGIGLGIAKAVEVAAVRGFGIELVRAYVSYRLIGGALLFSFLVGALSGVAPAYQASKQKPIDALRYE